MVASHSIQRSLGVGGWMSPIELEWLAINALEREFIVEFGCFHGRSTRALADNCPGKVWAVDPWNGNYAGQYEDGSVINTYVFPYFYQNLRDHIESGKVIPVRKFSYDFTLDQLVDMVFIDGDHRGEVVQKDIDKALGMLKEGGLICGHDYGHPGWPDVKMVVDERFPVEVVDTIWYTKKS